VKVISHAHGPEGIFLQRLPVHWWLAETLWDKLCVLSGHRLCGRWVWGYQVLSWVTNKAHQHTNTFTVAANDDTIRAFDAWMGWDNFHVYEDDE
jgi:hypothetical protein